MSLTCLDCSIINSLTISSMSDILVRIINIARTVSNLISDIDGPLMLTKCSTTIWYFLVVLNTDYMHETAQMYFVLMLHTSSSATEWSYLYQGPATTLFFQPDLPHVLDSCSNQKADSSLTQQTYHAISILELPFTAVFSYETCVPFSVFTTHPLLCKVPQVTQPAHCLHLHLAYILFCLVL